ncbi:TonB-dependent receptor [Novosphingobium sp. G106]|uniref:TonB-dependent receptor n=1 Tax=Novosphingobium sp. G106 TaxID=2849500 RepID=UPI001C2CDD64|nr:TonB-dependent receptor [Novosphingobium sp. G106]MBV1686263.1 TonB-dependent receptor [Novosphingobium sp. G106]
MLYKHFLHVLMVSTALLPASALAQSSGAAAEGSAQEVGEIGDIVVTAQKRSESVQKVPLAVTAIGSDALREAGITNVDALSSSVPALQIGQSYGSANISLRGISLNAVNFGAENPVAFHVDGVFLARPTGVLGSFFDMQRVEVLRGAQGTLYGRNATGGSINLITADPTRELSGYAQLTYGEYNHIGGEGAISGPLGSEDLLFRLSFRTDDRDGWGKNEFTGRDIDDNKERAIRGKLLFNATDTLRIKLQADYAESDDHQTPHYGGTPLGTVPWGVLLPSAFSPAPIPLGGTLPTRTRDISSEAEPSRHNSFWGASMTVDWALGAVDLKSITAYRGIDTTNQGDLDQTSAVLAVAGLFEKSRQVSQEFQLSHQGDKSNWILGAFYFHEKDDGQAPVAFSDILFQPLGIAPIPAPGTLRQGYYAGSQVKTDAYALFGQYTREVVDRLRVTIGARYSIERKSAINQGAFNLVDAFDQRVFETRPDSSTLTIQCGKGLPTIGFGTVPCTPSKTFRAFTPKLGLEFQATSSTLLYASVSKGFKSGVYNLGAVQPPVNPENIWDYEAGIKSTLLGGRLRANLSGFYYDYKDLQVNRVVIANALLENAAVAKIYGLEAEIVAKPTEAFQIDLTAAYLNATFSSFITADNARPAGDGVTIDEFGNPAFNLKGNRLAQSPKFSGKFGATYTIPVSPGNISVRGEAVYTSKIFWTPYNLEATSTAARTRFNASINFESVDRHWTASLNARNIANKVRVTNGFVSTLLTGFVVNGYVEAPRTIDFTVGYHF